MTSREQVLRPGLDALSTRPGPSSGILSAGFILLAKIRDKTLQLWDILVTGPSPEPGQSRSQVVSHQIS